MTLRDELTHVNEPLSLLRRLRAHCEAQMTPDFNPTLSLMLDDLLQQEEALILMVEENWP